MAGSQTAWGIDVGVSSLKAIKLRRDGDRVTVEAFDVIEHDRFLTEPDVDRDGTIRSTLGKFMNKYGVRRETVFISVPGSSTFARFVKLPPVETKKIPEIVRFEAIQQIPFPLDQVNWDYHTFQHPDSPDVEVGIFAMKKELVAGVMANFAAVDLAVTGVQMSPLAVYNAVAYDGINENKGTVVIDMGAEHTDLVIMDQGRLWLRTINIGGNHFTDALAKSFKQPFAKAESLKKTAATSKYQKQIYQSMRPIFADLVAEIQRSIGHYNSSHRDSRLERVVGMGNPFKLPNLQKYLQQELKMDVVRLEHFRNANVEKAAAFSEDILSMTAAYGLAIQGLGMAPIDTNLLPVEIARKMMWRQKTPWFIGATALIVLGVGAIAGQWMMASSAYAGQQAQRETNTASMAEAQRLITRWNQIPDSFAADKTKIDSSMKLAENRSVLPVLQLDILGSLPQANRGHPGTVIITEVLSEYRGKLSEWLTDPGAGGAQLGTTNLARAAVVPLDPAAAADLAAASTQPDFSDHGFVIRISGYTSTVGRSSDPVANQFRDTLMERGDRVRAKNKPYYFTNPWMQAHAMTPVLAPGTTGAGQFGTMGFGRVNSGNGTTADRIWWGNVKGPFWDLFAMELTGLKPPVPVGSPYGTTFNPQGMDTPQVLTELPYPIDMAAPKGADGAKPAMGNRDEFVLQLKVHVK